MRHGRLAVLAAIATCVAVVAAGATGSDGARAGKAVPADAIFVPSGTAPATQLTSPPCRRLCYSPAQLQAAYDWPTGKGAPTGAGQTIVVGVAFGSPTLEADLAAFDTAFGLPSTTLSYCGAPNSGAGNPAIDRQWGPETSADVEYAHAMAPNARIVVVIAPSDDFADMADVEAACLPKYPGAILVQAFGEDETDAADPAVAAAFDSLHATYEAVTESGGTVIAASGDFGATGINCFFGVGPCDPVAEYPASDPLVTAVGGTEGDPYPDGLLKQVPVEEPPPVQPVKPAKPEKPEKPPKKKFAANDDARVVYGGEQVWNESDTFGLATGGAPSILFPVPDYQQGVNGSASRTTSDVAYDAAGQGGEAVIWNGVLGTFGGTSIGPSHWAALVALTNELRASRGRDSIGQLNPALYATAADARRYARDFHDITSGNNADGGPGFDAGPGYDLPTGLGTPDVANLIDDLASAGSRHDGDGEGRRKDAKPPKPDKADFKLHAG